MLDQVHAIDPAPLEVRARRRRRSASSAICRHLLTVLATALLRRQGRPRPGPLRLRPLFLTARRSTTGRWSITRIERPTPGAARRRPALTRCRCGRALKPGVSTRLTSFSVTRFLAGGEARRRLPVRRGRDPMSFGIMDMPRPLARRRQPQHAPTSPRSTTWRCRPGTSGARCSSPGETPTASQLARFDEPGNGPG